MYDANAIEQKVIDLYRTGDVDKAVNYTKLTGYKLPILVDVKLQSEWLCIRSLRDSCNVDVGESYNESIPWLFIIHNNEFKVLPLAPVVHSISYEMLLERNVVCNATDSTNIQVDGDKFLVSLFQYHIGKYAEHDEIYTYLLSKRIKKYLLDIEDSSNFQVDFMKEYNKNPRYYDYVWIIEFEYLIPYIFELEPKEFLLWNFTQNASAVYSKSSAFGNKMAWLPVLRWRGKV